jgi:hypothetical protein
MALLVLDRYKLPKQQAIRVRYGITNAVFSRYKYAWHDYRDFPHDYIHCNIPDGIVAEIIGSVPDEDPADIRTTSHRYFPRIFTHTKFLKYGDLHAIVFAQVGILRETTSGSLVPIHQIPMAAVISIIQNS